MNGGVVFTAMVCLYSTGHWIGGTVLLLVFGGMCWDAVDDPTGTKALFAALRRGQNSGGEKL